jgi:hypothetical protein
VSVFVAEAKDRNKRINVEKHNENSSDVEERAEHKPAAQILKNDDIDDNSNF